jgi:penicillin-binding protein 1C
VKLYTGLAQLGVAVPLSERLGANTPEARRLLEPAAAWYVSKVLLGVPPPENGVAGRIAFKTGTSYGYRDAWSVGFDGKHTIGVWVGRPDGAPVPGLIGREAAAPILFDAFARLGGSTTPLPRAPAGVVFATNTKLPPPLRHFQPGRLAGATAQPPLRIMFPPDGARLDLAGANGKPDPVLLKVTGAVAPVTVLVNGVPVEGEDKVRGSSGLFFTPAGPGFSRVTVTDASGAAASIEVWANDAAAIARPPALDGLIQKFE